MKKVLLLLLTVIPMSLFCLTWSYHFDKPTIRNGEIQMKGCSLNPKATEPAIAVKQIRLLLPYNQKAVSYNIEYGRAVDLENEILVRPIVPSGRLSKTPTQPISHYSDCYQIDEYYPQTIRDHNFVTQYKNGHPIFISMLYPVRYNPVTKRAFYYPDITITIQTQADYNANYRQNSIIARNIKQLVDNPMLIDDYPQTSRSVNDYDYLIITTNQYAESLTPFTEFNLRRGLKTQIATKEDIVTSVTGTDVPDKIRNYIRTQYQEHGITYVLLVGDNEILPHRGFRSEINDYGYDYYNETDMPADMYFSCLDGTWQNTGSQYYGEAGSEDVFYEVYASRFAIDSTTELTRMMDKTIAFSETPVLASSTHNLLVGEYLWGPPEFPTETWASAYMNELVDTCSANNYFTTGFSDFWSNNTLYDDTNDWDGNTIISRIQQQKPVMIDHLGHSNVTYNMRMSNGEVTDNNFTNDGTNANYFIIYSQGCYSGSFDNRSPEGYYGNEDCIGEKFTTITNGAVAYIGNSRYGLGSPYNTDGAGQVFHRYFHDATFGHNIHSLEMMNAYSKEIAAPLILEEDITLAPYWGSCKWIAYGLNILGDPALSLWSQRPQTLIPSYPETFSITHPFIIHSAPFANLAVMNDSLLFTDTADSLGDYDLAANEEVVNYVSRNPQGYFTFNIKADNYLPYQNSLNYAITENNDNTMQALVTALTSYPNPFNPSTTISFNLGQRANVKLVVYNSKGQRIKELINEEKNTGTTKVTWNGKNENSQTVASGVYFYRLSVNGKELPTQKIVLMK